MKTLLSGRRERRFHLQLSQVICFQSVKYGFGFVYYLCLGFSLRGRKKGMEKEKRSPSISERSAALSNYILRYSSF